MRNSEAKRLSSLEIAIHVISSAHQPLRSSPQKPTSARAAISDAVANNGLKTAARRSQCSVPDGTQVDHNHQLAGSLCRPHCTKVGRHSGFSASSSRRLGRRRNRVAMAILLFDSRELGTKAEVNTASEGQRTYIGPGDIQSIRPIRIDCWVSIGRPQQAEHALTLPDFLPANVVDVLERITRSITDREQADGHEYQRENSFCSGARRKVANARAQGWLPAEYASRSP
jgi:hypothetical protein